MTAHRYVVERAQDVEQGGAWVVIWRAHRAASIRERGRVESPDGIALCWSRSAAERVAAALNAARARRKKGGAR